MADMQGSKRVDTASKVVKASPQAVYRAFVDPEALISWLPPKGMRGRIDVFDPRPGGSYRMTLTYENPGDAAPGKSSEGEDIVDGRFLELVPGERVVQLVEFQSNDPAFAGEMTMTWKLATVEGGTEVTIMAENVPEGIRPEDHDAGLKSSLENLAAFVE